MESVEVEFKKGDLFNSTDEALAHCVSKDLAMGAGIAKEFRKRFGKVDFLKEQQCNVGEVAYMDSWNKKAKTTQTLFYMVTKEKYYQKPTIRTLGAALKRLRYLVTEMGITTLSMPMISSGLDQMSWPLVLQEIETAFYGSEVKITIWYLK